MISADRYGTALPSSPAPEPVSWAVRLIDTGGVFNSTAAWVYYAIPDAAVLSRSRSASLDGKTWTLELELLANAIPSVREPLAFYQIEIDAVDANGYQWPYFTGPIQAISQAFREEAGAIVETLRVACEGTLARAKGYRANAAALNPVTEFTFGGVSPGLLTGYVIRVAIASTTFLSGGTYRARVHGSSHSYNIQDTTSANVDFRGMLVATDAGFTAIVAPASYTVTIVANDDAELNFGAVSPGATVYIAFWRPAHWGIPYWRSSFAAPDWILVPYPGITYTGTNALPKRRVFDTFQTYAATGTGNGAAGTPIIVQDPTPFTTSAGIVAVTGGPTEVLAWTKSNGTEEYRQVSSVNATGQITLTAGFSATPAVGDPIRLATTEIKRAWDLHNEDNSIFPSSTRSYPVRYFRNNAYATELGANIIESVPTAGIARPAGGAVNWLDTGLLYQRLGAAPLNFLADSKVSIGLDNTIESGLYALFVTGTSLYAASDIVTGGFTGSFIKGAEWWNTTIDQVFESICSQTLAPNAFAHDRPDGKLEIAGYTQAATPSLMLNRVISIEVQEEPSPLTAATVISIGQEPINITKTLNPRDATGTFAGAVAALNQTGTAWTNFSRLFDGNRELTATNAAAAVTDVGRVIFEIRHKPIQIFPMIDRISIWGGNGTVRVWARGINESTKAVTKIASLNRSFYVLSANGETVIDGELVNSLLADTGADYSELVLDFYYPASGTISCAEIEVWAKRQSAWTAYLSDDTTGSPPTGWSSIATGATAGPSWWQRSLTAPESYRFAPTSLMKRISPRYGSTYQTMQHRLEVYELTQLSQDECRDYAEQFVNQAVAGATNYRVTAYMDNRIALGDTVGLMLPDGTVKTLMVWAMDDSGGRDDRTAVYTLIDYSL